MSASEAQEYGLIDQVIAREGIYQPEISISSIV